MLRVPLKWKLCLLTGVLLAVITVQTSLAYSGKPSHDVTLLLTGFAYLAGGGITFGIARRLTVGVADAIKRLDAVDQAAKRNLMRGLEALAVGDLTVELQPSTSELSDIARDEFGEIMRQTEHFRDAIVFCYGAYNDAVEKVRELMSTVTTSAGTLTSASIEMSSTSKQAGAAVDHVAQAIIGVAEGADLQTQMAESAQRSAAEIGHAVGETAENAQHAAQVAQDAHQAAKRGVEAADQANLAMGSVRESSNAVTEVIRELAGKSEQIGQIVQTISGIAEQTNLLALNAAIEAARAGEQGKGFAVVAEEVRKLAEDSQRAALEISGLIGSMQSETTRAVSVVEDGATRTQEGAAVVEQTREAFLSIGQAVQDMTSRIEQIAASAQQITATAAGMRENVDKVANVAEQCSESTEDITASAEETFASAEQIATSAEQLAANADTLNELVAQFKVKR
ncbi:MAG: methyl-accepting chemotaxis protein [Solirubrobacteraceae bacterium]